MNKTATAVVTTGLGFMLLWSGITNAGVLSTLQNLVTGHAPMPGMPQASLFSNTSSITSTAADTPIVGNGSATGSAIAAAALKYQGAPYYWGGKTPGGTFGSGPGWDCYGFTTYVLHHDLGYNLPNNTYSGFLEMLAWSGATTIPTSQIQAGDLVMWQTHIGIAVSSTEMISAENPSAGTRVDTFANGGPGGLEVMMARRINGGAVLA
jgi:cell wall-associated NlpC family hydrolase